MAGNKTSFMAFDLEVSLLLVPNKANIILQTMSCNSAWHFWDMILYIAQSNTAAHLKT